MFIVIYQAHFQEDSSVSFFESLKEVDEYMNELEKKYGFELTEVGKDEVLEFDNFYQCLRMKQDRIIVTELINNNYFRVK